MWQLCQHTFKKKKMVNFGAVILKLKMKEKNQHFGILCIIISRKVDTYTHKKDFCSVWRKCYD